MMRSLTVGSVLILASSLFLACQPCGSADLESFEGRSSYAIGIDFGNRLAETQAEIDIPSLVQGISDVLEDREAQLTDEEVVQVLTELQTRLQASHDQRQAETAERQTEAAERNLQEGAEYLAENGQREGVTTTESGLQYEVITSGTGARPTAADEVSVHYRGTLIDGTEFDSSYERGEPATFVLSRVIAGWTEGLQLMNVGSRYRFVIPSNLAYGPRGAGAQIGPNATLVFEVELLDIVGQ